MSLTISNNDRSDSSFDVFVLLLADRWILFFVGDSYKKLSHEGYNAVLNTLSEAS